MKREMEEEFNKGGKQGWIISADAARIADENASSENNKHTGVFVAVDSDAGAVIGKEEGAVASIPGNEGRSAPAWVKMRRGMQVLSVYFWHSEGWTRETRLCLKQ